MAPGGEMFRKLPRRLGFSAIFGSNRYLAPFNRGIATTSVRTGLAMTGILDRSDKQQFIGKLN